MAVQSDTSRISYAGNNSTSTSYAVPFVFLENSHLKAIAKTSAGVETVVTLTNHTGAGNVNGGTVRTAVAVPATSTLTIFRDVPITQTTTYAEGGDFPAASHERALDKLTTITQQLDRRINTCVRGSEATPLSPLPSPTGTQQFVLATTFNQPPAWQPQSAIAIGPVIATGSSEPRFVSDRFADAVNVKDFGAVGDGLADDTAAIQAWAAFCARGTSDQVNLHTTGAKGYAPAGTYLFSGAIKINFPIFGDGIGVTIFKSTASSARFEFYTPPISSSQQPSITSDFTINGNGIATGDLVTIGKNNAGHFANIGIVGSLGNGLVLSGTNNTLFTSLWLANNAGTSILFQEYDSQGACGNHFVKCEVAGFGEYAVVIEGNSFSNTFSSTIFEFSTASTICTVRVNPSFAANYALTFTDNCSINSQHAVPIIVIDEGFIAICDSTLYGDNTATQGIQINKAGFRAVMTGASAITGCDYCIYTTIAGAFTRTSQQFVNAANVSVYGSSVAGRTIDSDVSTLIPNVLDLRRGQIAFPATAIPSAGANILDDYEEGTFTPTLLSNGSSTGITMAAAGFNQGSYVKIGAIVFVNILCAASVNTGTVAAGNVTIGGLPNFGSFGAEGAAFTVAKYYGLTNGTTLTAQHNGTTGISLFASQIDATTQAGNTALAHTTLGANVGIYLSGCFMASRS